MEKVGKGNANPSKEGIRRGLQGCNYVGQKRNWTFFGLQADNGLFYRVLTLLRVSLGPWLKLPRTVVADFHRRYSRQAAIQQSHEGYSALATVVKHRPFSCQPLSLLSTVILHTGEFQKGEKHRLHFYLSLPFIWFPWNVRLCEWNMWFFIWKEFGSFSPYFLEYYCRKSWFASEETNICFGNAKNGFWECRRSLS